MKKGVYYGVCVAALFLSACNTSYSVVSVEGGRVPITQAYDAN